LLCAEEYAHRGSTSYSDSPGGSLDLAVRPAWKLVEAGYVRGAAGPAILVVLGLGLWGADAGRDGLCGCHGCPFTVLVRLVTRAEGRATVDEITAPTPPRGGPLTLPHDFVLTSRCDPGPSQWRLGTGLDQREPARTGTPDRAWLTGSARYQTTNRDGERTAPLLEVDTS